MKLKYLATVLLSTLLIVGTVYGVTYIIDDDVVDLRGQQLGAAPYVLTERQGGTGSSSPQHFLYGNAGTIESVGLGDGLALSSGRLAATAFDFANHWGQRVMTTGTSFLETGNIYSSSTLYTEDVVVKTKDLDKYLNHYNGSFLESFNATSTSDGTDVEFILADSATYTGGLTMRFSTGDVTLATPQSIYLVAGTNAIPQANYVYIPYDTQVLTTSTSGWPSATEHIKVAYTLVPSAAYVQSDGLYVNQNWNDHAMNGDNQGHMTHIAEKIRRLGATYYSGIDGNGDASTYIERTNGTPDTVYIKSTSGVIYQMHEQTIPAKDTSAGDDFHIPNSSVSAYEVGTDLYNFLTDADGDSMSGKYYNLVMWYVANKTGQYSPIMINLPTCSYGIQSNAEQDIDGCDVFTIPSQFKTESSTGFLVARLTMKHTLGTQDLELMSTVDLRGLNVASATGGTAGGVLTDFPDSQFTVFDDLDNTKIMNFQASGITTGNTRTLTIPDASGTMCLLDATQTLTNKTITADYVTSTAAIDAPLYCVNGASCTNSLGGDPFSWTSLTWQGVNTNSTSSNMLVNADFSVIGTTTHQGTIKIGNGTVTTTLNNYAGRKTVELILYRPLDSIASSTNKILSFEIPESLNGMNLVTSTAYVDSVAISDGDTTSTTIDIYNETDGTSMLTNLLGIGHGSRFSRSASTTPYFQINTGADDVATYDEISVYIKQTSGGTAPKGLVVSLGFELP